MKRYVPYRGTTYTLEQIVNELYLRDSPSLCIDDIGVIQDSHLTNGVEDLLTIQSSTGESFSNSLWRFIRETDEWIPIFTNVNDERNLKLILDCVDVARYLDPFTGREVHGKAWITPKGFTREQVVFPI